MSQRFHVLRCYKCETFQSHIVKKSHKWDCKMCGDKQSLMKVFGEGTGKECRLHVQKLNTLRMVKDRNSIDSAETAPSQPELETAPPLVNHTHSEQIYHSPSFISKWAKYTESHTKTLEPEDPPDQLLSSDLEYVLELPERKQKPKASIKLAKNNNMFTHSPISKGKRKSDTLNEDCNSYEQCLDSNFMDCLTEEDIPYNKPPKIRDIHKPKTEMVIATSSKWAKYMVDNTADY